MIGVVLAVGANHSDECVHGEFAKPSGIVDKLILDLRWNEAQCTLDDQATELVIYSQNLTSTTHHRLLVESGSRKTLRGVR